MKKFFLFITLVIVAYMSVMAQNTIVNNPENKPYFGIRVGGDITCPGKISVDNVGISVFKNGGGIEFGGVYNIPIIANFFIEPGLKLYYNTYSLKNEFVKDLQDDIIFNNVSFKKFGMRIPVMAGYHFDLVDDIKVYVFTGPELEVGFSAKEYIKGHNIDMSESVYGEDGGMNRVNLLWSIGTGISYRQLYFGVNGALGMLNMLHDSNGKFRENRVTFSVGYNF